MTKKILFSFLLLLPLLCLAQPYDYTNNYITKLNANQYINLFLAVNGEHVSGYYSYSKQRQNSTYWAKPEWFSGKLSQGRLRLSAFDYSNSAPLFAGTIQHNKQAVTINGQWRATANGQPQAVRFHPHNLLVNKATQLTQHSIYQQSNNDHYYLRITYPQISGQYLNANEQQFNHYVKQHMQRLQQQYVKQFQSTMKDWLGHKSKKLPLPLSTSSNSLVVHNEITLVTPRLVSIRFQIYTNFYGAAHPNMTTQTINYDLKTGRPLLLADLFSKDSVYLALLAKASQQQLIKRLIIATTPKEDAVYQRQWIERGVSPKPANYVRWNLRNNGLLITFDTYQVAAYVYGPQVITVPFSELKQVIPNKGVLASLY